MGGFDGPSEGGYGGGGTESGGEGGGGRGDFPSRASPGGGYHGPGGAVSEGGYTGMGRDISVPGPFGKAIGTLLGWTTFGKLVNMLSEEDQFDMENPANWGLPNQPNRPSGRREGMGEGGEKKKGEPEKPKLPKDLEKRGLDWYLGIMDLPWAPGTKRIGE